MNRLFTVEQVEAHNKRVREHKNATAPATLSPPPSQEGVGPVAAAPKPEYETWLENQLIAAGVHGMEREYQWCRGRKFTCDIAIPEKRLLVEIDSAVHRTSERFKRDIERNQLSILQGWVLLRVYTAQVRNGEACALVKRVLDLLMAKTVPF